MKSIFALLLAISAFSVLISCSDGLQKSAGVSTQKADTPVMKEAVAHEALALVPTRWALTELTVTKEEDGDCSGKGNIDASFILSFSDSILQNNGMQVVVHGYDCSGSNEGKQVKANYLRLQKCNAADLAIIYTWKGDQYALDRIVIVDKEDAGKDGGPAKLTPGVKIWGN